jgi:hypothetical protein
MKCENCKINPTKIVSKGKNLCFHCWLGDRFYRLYPNGIDDEVDIKAKT